MTYIDHQHVRVAGATADGSAADSREPAAGRARTGAARRRHPWWSPLVVFLVADVTALLAAAAATGSSLAFTAGVVVGTVLGIRRADLYRREVLPTALTQIGTLAITVAAGSLVAAAIAGTSSTEAVWYAAAAAPALVLCRSVAYAHERRMSGRDPERAIVVGTGPDGQQLVSRLLDHPEFGIVPVGFVDDIPVSIDPDLPVGVLGEISDLVRFIDAHRVTRVFLDAGSVSERELVEVLDCATQRGVEISVLPTLSQHLSAAIAVEGLAGTTVLSYRPSAKRGISWGLKRLVDVLGAVLMLVVSAPVWLVTAIAIKLDSPGPVLFRQERVGRNGRRFICFKFRTMVRDAENLTEYLQQEYGVDGRLIKHKEDPRRTRVGRILRKFSLDELPQFVNILLGEMSVVGPRPPVPSEVAKYDDWHHGRLLVTPGLTGLWQVSGRSNLTFDEMVRLDLYYAEHWSPWLDVKIMLRTIPAVITGRGAY